MPEDSSNMQPSPSMEEILRTIRGVISGSEKPAESDEAKSENDLPENNQANEDDDFLELTPEMEAPEDAQLGSENFSENLENKENDILGNIDQILSEKEDSNAEQENDLSNPLEDKDSANNQTKSQENKPHDEILDRSFEDEDTKKDEFSTQSDLKKSEINLSKVENPAKETEKNLPQDFTKDSASEEKIMSQFVSENSAKATRAAFEELVHKTPRPHADGPVLRSGISLEELVVEALRPYLVEWLDKNLPSLVKQIVEKEIRRLVPNDPD